jgi:hypothetical protein
MPPRNTHPAFHAFKDRAPERVRVFVMSKNGAEKERRTALIPARICAILFEKQLSTGIEGNDKKTVS